MPNYGDLAEAEFAKFLVNLNARYRISRQKSGVAGNRISGFLFTYKNDFIGKFGRISGLLENRISGMPYPAFGRIPDIKTEGLSGRLFGAVPKRYINM